MANILVELLEKDIEEAEASTIVEMWDMAGKQVTTDHLIEPKIHLLT